MDRPDARAARASAKKKATPGGGLEILAEWTSRVFLTRVVADQQLPFELKSPNAATKAAMREARNLGNARFATAKALIDDLEEGAKQ